MIDTTKIQIKQTDYQAKNKQLEHTIDLCTLQIQKQDKMLANLRETVSEVQGLRSELQNKQSIIKQQVYKLEALQDKLDNNKLLLKVERLRRIKAEHQTEHYYKTITTKDKQYFDIVEGDLI